MMVLVMVAASRRAVVCAVFKRQWSGRIVIGLASWLRLSDNAEARNPQQMLSTLAPEERARWSKILVEGQNSNLRTPRRRPRPRTGSRQRGQVYPRLWFLDPDLRRDERFGGL